MRRGTLVYNCISVRLWVVYTRQESPGVRDGFVRNGTARLGRNRHVRALR